MAIPCLLKSQEIEQIFIGYRTNPPKRNHKNDEKSERYEVSIPIYKISMFEKTCVVEKFIHLSI